MTSTHDLAELASNHAATPAAQVADSDSPATDEAGDAGAAPPAGERPPQLSFWRKLQRRLAKIRKRTWVITAVITVLVIGAAIWVTTLMVSQQSAAATPITQTVAASLETMEKAVQASGTLTPKVQESVSFVASGTVTSVDVVEGDTVEKGQKLASVNTLQVDANLLQARADLADAEAQLASAQEAADGTASSDAQIAARESAVKVASQSVTDAEGAVAGATLVAPVAGLITSVDVKVGDSVTGTTTSSSSSSAGGSGTDSGASGMPGMGGGSSSTSSSSSDSSTAQFTIVGTDSWSVSVSLGETEIGLIEKDDQVELETSDGTKLFGVVSEIGRLPSTSSGTAAFPVTIDITGETEGLFDGTSVTATIIYERRTEVLTVPSAAVTTAEDGTTTVTKVDAEGNESEQVVTIGEVSGNLTEIVEGLSEGDQVIYTVFTPGEGNSGGSQMPDFGGGQMPDFGNMGGGRQ